MLKTYVFPINKGFFCKKCTGVQETQGGGAWTIDICLSNPTELWTHRTELRGNDELS